MISRLTQEYSLYFLVLLTLQRYAQKEAEQISKNNDKVVTLPKAAIGRGSRVYPNGRSSSNPFEEREKAATVINQFVEAVEQGSISVERTDIPRHFREALKD